MMEFSRCSVESVPVPAYSSSAYVNDIICVIRSDVDSKQAFVAWRRATSPINPNAINLQSYLHSCLTRRIRAYIHVICKSIRKNALKSPNTVIIWDHHQSSGVPVMLPLDLCYSLLLAYTTHFANLYCCSHEPRTSTRGAKVSNPSHDSQVFLDTFSKLGASAAGEYDTR